MGRNKYLRSPMAARAYEIREEKKAKAVELWDKGIATWFIAERLGQSQTTIATWLKEAGVDGLDGSRRSEPRHA